MKITIVYETQTGTTQYVAEVLRDALHARGYEVTLHNLWAAGPVVDFSAADTMVLAAPTYDDGLLEKNMREWITKNSPDLQTKKLAIVGLGNRTFPQFCTVVSILEKWVAEHQGKLCVESLRVDNFPDDKEIREWAQKLDATLSSPVIPSGVEESYPSDPSTAMPAPAGLAAQDDNSTPAHSEHSAPLQTL